MKITLNNIFIQNWTGSYVFNEKRKNNLFITISKKFNGKIKFSTNTYNIKKKEKYNFYTSKILKETFNKKMEKFTNIKKGIKIKIKQKIFSIGIIRYLKLKYLKKKRKMLERAREKFAYINNLIKNNLNITIKKIQEAFLAGALILILIKISFYLIEGYNLPPIKNCFILTFSSFTSLKFDILEKIKIVYVFILKFCLDSDFTDYEKFGFGEREDEFNKIIYKPQCLAFLKNFWAILYKISFEIISFLNLLRLTILIEPFLFFITKYAFISFLLLNKTLFFTYIISLAVISSRIIFFLTDNNITEFNKNLKILETHLKIQQPKQTNESIFPTLKNARLITIWNCRKLPELQYYEALKRNESIIKLYDEEFAYNFSKTASIFIKPTNTYSLSYRKKNSLTNAILILFLIFLYCMLASKAKNTEQFETLISINPLVKNPIVRNQYQKLNEIPHLVLTLEEKEKGLTNMTFFPFTSKELKTSKKITEGQYINAFGLNLKIPTLVKNSFKKEFIKPKEFYQAKIIERWSASSVKTSFEEISVSLSCSFLDCFAYINSSLYMQITRDFNRRGIAFSDLQEKYMYSFGKAFSGDVSYEVIAQQLSTCQNLLEQMREQPSNFEMKQFILTQQFNLDRLKKEKGSILRALKMHKEVDNLHLKHGYKTMDESFQNDLQPIITKYSDVD